MAIASLSIAYVWDCDDCGRENFVRCIAADFGEDELQELRDEHGVEAWETGDFVTMPDKVTCKHCGAEFDTERNIADED